MIEYLIMRHGPEERGHTISKELKTGLIRLKYIMDLSFQKKKNSLEICFLVTEILNKYKRSIFF